MGKEMKKMAAAARGIIGVRSTGDWYDGIAHCEMMLEHGALRGSRDPDLPDTDLRYCRWIPNLPY